jgi:hypothetical protein
MASTINLSGLAKYTDQLSQALVRESVLGGETFKYITVIPNIKNADALNKMTSSFNAVAGGCGLISPTGSVVITQNTLTVCPIKIEESICENDIEQYWLGMFMAAGSYNEEIGPKEFAQVYTADKTAKLQAYMDDLFWKASPTPSRYSSDPNLTLCTGLLETLEYTSATLSVVSGNGTYSSNTTMTVANAISIVDGMISAMNTSASQILTENDLTLFVSYADFNTLITAWRQFNGFHITVGSEENGASRWSFMYPGQTVKVVAVRGLNGTNKRLLTNGKNLAMGTDLETDYSKFRIWFEDLYDTVYFRAKFKIGANAYFYQNIVFFK